MARIKPAESYVLWQNPGTADIWTSAANNDTWMYFTPGAGKPGTSTYVPGVSLTDTDSGSVGTPSNPSLLAPGWWTVDTAGASFIGIQILSRVTNATGSVAPMCLNNPFRMVCQGIFGTDADPDFSYPPSAALGILDAAGISTGGEPLLNCAVSIVPGSDIVLGNWGVANGTQNLTSMTMLPNNASLASLTNQRGGINLIIAGRPDTKAFAGTAGAVIPISWRWQRLCFQLLTGFKASAVAGNELATLRIKAQVKMFLWWI